MGGDLGAEEQRKTRSAEFFEHFAKSCRAHAGALRIGETNESRTEGFEPPEVCEACRRSRKQEEAVEVGRGGLLRGAEAPRRREEESAEDAVP